MLRSATYIVALVLLLVSRSALALDTGAHAPSIGLPDLKGAMTDIPHGKVVVVDVWASWCGPCKKELPALQRLYQRYSARGFRVIAVNIDKERNAVEAFLHEHPVTFTVVPDPEASVPARYEPKTMPSSYMIDTHGIVRHVYTGFHDGDDAKIERDLKELLPEPEPESSSTAPVATSVAPTTAAPAELAPAATAPSTAAPTTEGTAVAPEAAANLPPSAAPSPAGRHAGLCTVGAAQSHAPSYGSALVLACVLLLRTCSRRRR